MSEVEEIIKKVLQDNKIIKYRSYFHKCMKEAMKEIASIAFNEGYAAAGCIGDASYEREEFLSKLFDNG